MPSNERFFTICVFWVLLRVPVRPSKAPASRRESRALAFRLTQNEEVTRGRGSSFGSLHASVTFLRLKMWFGGLLGGSVSWASTLAQVVISRCVGSSPASGSVLTARSLEPASDSGSPSLSAPSLLSLSLSEPSPPLHPTAPGPCSSLALHPPPGPPGRVCPCMCACVCTPWRRQAWVWGGLCHPPLVPMWFSGPPGEEPGPLGQKQDRREASHPLGRRSSPAVILRRTRHPGTGPGRPAARGTALPARKGVTRRPGASSGSFSGNNEGAGSSRNSRDGRAGGAGGTNGQSQGRVSGPAVCRVSLSIGGAGVNVSRPRSCPRRAPRSLRGRGLAWQSAAVMKDPSHPRSRGTWGPRRVRFRGADHGHPILPLFAGLGSVPWQRTSVWSLTLAPPELQPQSRDQVTSLALYQPCSEPPASAGSGPRGAGS